MTFFSSAAKRTAAGLVTAATLVACSGSIAKNANDDRSKNPAGTNPGTGETVQTPVGSNAPAKCTTAATQPTPVYLMFAVDGSNSMRDDNKWSAVVDAMNLIIDQSAASGVVAAGLIGFGDKNDPTDELNDADYGPYPSSIDVPIGFVDAAHAAALKRRLAETEPNGLTPTWPALKGAYEALRAFKPAAPLATDGRRVAVLITDGFPFSKPSSPSADATAEQTQASLEAAALHASEPDPILTFAVGVGGLPGDGVEYDPTFPGRVAYYGGTRQSPTCNPMENANPANVCHFQITPGQKTAAQVREDAINAINTIRHQITSCQFKVEAPPGGLKIDGRSISVRYTTLNGATTVILPGATNGWSVDNPQSPAVVQLNGDACVKHRDQGGKVEILLACQ